MKSILLIYGTVLLSLASCSGSGEKNNMELVNPASKNCIKKGGKLQMAKRGDGGQYGICYFEDNRQCEEWALFRGQCPVGGVKVTGYTTPEGQYCSITGGRPKKQETQCNLPSGKICNAKQYYNGSC